MVSWGTLPEELLLPSRVSRLHQFQETPQTRLLDVPTVPVFQ